MFFQPKNSIGKTTLVDFPRLSHPSTSTGKCEPSTSPPKHTHSRIVATIAAGKAVTKVQVQPNIEHKQKRKKKLDQRKAY
jgi:hypothetical protein